MDIPGNLRFTKTHEWVRLKKDVALVGITDFAQEEIEEIISVELPEVGDDVEIGHEFATVESDVGARDVYAPLSGEIIEVNDALVSAPETVNSDPYGEGWIAKIRISDPAEVRTLLTAEAYEEFLAETPADDLP